MKGKAKVAVLVVTAAATLVIGFLLAPTSEAGGGKPVMIIPLTASFRQFIPPVTVPPQPWPTDRILGDRKGLYIHNVAGAGSVSVHLVGTQWQNGGNFYMELDNAGDETLGRTVGFLFHDWDHSCHMDGDRLDSTSFMDFPVGAGSPVVESRWVQFKTYFTYVKNPVSERYNESLEVLDFTAMEPGEIAYVGMANYFRITMDDATVSDEYYMGFRWDPVEVQVMKADQTGKPLQWAIRPIQDSNVYENIYQTDVDSSHKAYLPDRMLLQIHYPTGGKRNRYEAQCYGIYKMPFELTLNRM
jgi:hypothetical protein